MTRPRHAHDIVVFRSWQCQSCISVCDGRRGDAVSSNLSLSPTSWCFAVDSANRLCACTTAAGAMPSHPTCRCHPRRGVSQLAVPIVVWPARSNAAMTCAWEVRPAAVAGKVLGRDAQAEGGGQRRSQEDAVLHRSSDVARSDPESDGQGCCSLQIWHCSCR